MNLTPRQKEIFELNNKCLSRSDMCKILGITKKILNTHLNDIAAKLTMPEKMNVQYFMACLKLKQLEKRQLELEKIINECSKRDKKFNKTG